jgi:hypothetical protein
LPRIVFSPRGKFRDKASHNFIAASIAIVQSTLAKQYPYSSVMAVSAATIFLLAIVATALGRERHGVVFGGNESENPPLLEE